MPKPKKADRSEIAEKNITFRATERTRAMLDALVAAENRAAATGAIGGRVSMGGYLKGLIEREARQRGLVPAEQPVAMSNTYKKK